MRDDTSSALRLILASASPRRRELLTALGLVFDILPTGVEEQPDYVRPPAPAALADFPADLPIEHHPTRVAWEKACAAADQVAGTVILAADTVVTIDGLVLNKPADRREGREMLRRLSGRRHTVYTGLCALAPDRTAHFALSASAVEFFPLADATITAYLATGESLDKAGAYGIQGRGGEFIRAVHGSFTGVVGLPLPQTAELLAAVGISVAVDPASAYQRWLDRQGKEVPPWPPTSP